MPGQPYSVGPMALSAQKMNVPECIPPKLEPVPFHFCSTLPSSALY